MCYSAQLELELKKLKREQQARVDYEAFEKLTAQRLTDDSIKIPKALEANFLEPNSPVEQRIFENIQKYNSRRTTLLETELFKQKARLGDAEGKLKLKATKAAQESQRIATSKIEWHLEKIADLKRTELEGVPIFV